MNVPSRFKSSAEANRPAGRGARLRLAAIAAALALACLGAGASRADGDAAKGKAAFVRQCAICHTVDKGDDSRFGPNLFGILGKKAGTAAGFAYTNAFKTRANWEWTEDALGGWMMFPSTMIPGTAMGSIARLSSKTLIDCSLWAASTMSQGD